MTRAERRRIIYEACEKIEKGHEYFACCALADASEGFLSDLRREFCLFYDEKSLKEYLWQFVPWWPDNSEQSQHERIMALLFFEVAG